MEFLNKNLKEVEKINKSLFEGISESSISEDFFFKDENLYIKKNDRIVEAYNLEEYKKLVDSIENKMAKKEDITVLIGCGKGGLLKKLIEVMDEDHIILVLEPIYFLIRNFLESGDYSELIEKRNLIFIECKENFVIETISLLSQLKVIRNWNTVLEPYVVERMDTYKTAMDTAISTINQIQCSVGTVTGAGPIIAENDIRNLPYILGDKGVDCLKDKYSGKSAILVSTGPSLGKNIHLLNQAKKNGFIIIAVAQALRALLAYGVKPHFICTVDYGKTNYEHFKGLFHIEDIPLVVLNRTYYEILQKWKGPKFITVSDQTPIPDTLQEFISSKGSLIQGGSVSHLCMGLAIHLGCKNISLVGSDLAYENDRSHIPLADASGDIKIGEAGQINWEVDDPSSHLNGEKNSMGYAQYVNSYFYDSIIPAKLPTNLGLLSFITSFERITKMEAAKEVTFYNSTEGGANIEGYKNISLRQYLLLNEEKEEVPLMSKEDSILNNPFSDLRKCFSLLQKDQENLKEIIRNAKKGIQSAEKMRSILNRPGGKEWQKQAKINTDASQKAHGIARKNNVMEMKIFKANREIYFGKYGLKRPNEKNSFKNNDEAVDRNIYILSEAKKAARELGRVYRDVEVTIRKAISEGDLYYMKSEEEEYEPIEKAKEYFDIGNFAWPMEYARRNIKFSYKVKESEMILKAAQMTISDKIKEAENNYDEREKMINYSSLILESKKGVKEESFSQEFFEKSLSKIDEAVDIFPKKIQARWGKASVLHHLKRYQESEDLYNELIEEFPDYHRLKFERCLLYMSMNEPNSMTLFKDFIDDNKDAYGHFYLKIAKMFIKKEDKKIAIDCIDSYLELFPISEEAKSLKKTLV